MIHISLTAKEVRALLALITIARFGAEGEGDYQDFDYKSMDSARQKLVANTKGEN